MCLLTTAGALWLAPGEIGLVTAFAGIVGAGLTVGSANAFNMWWERASDARMSRTRHRPLPAGRLSPVVACWFAWVLGVLGLTLLWVGANPTTAIVGAVAMVLYVLVYTPLKYRTPLALVIGAIPGAAPPLIGWTAATASIDAPGVTLALILLVWQIPHFLAIALYRKHEYARAGIRCAPVVRGDAIAKIQAALWATLLIPISMMPTPLGLTGSLYCSWALVLSTAFCAWSFTGLRNDAGPRWARGLFLASLVYLPLLTLALAIDVVL